MIDVQPDFSKIFSETFASGAHPIQYSIRDGPNFLHDLAFVSSLVHDARVQHVPTVVQNGIVEIPLNRDCWELPYTDHGNSLELHVADSILRLSGVTTIAWQFDQEAADNPWIYYLWADPAYRDSRKKHFAFYLVGEDWKSTITLTHDDWKIELRDLVPPYLWSSKNPS